MRHLHHFYTLGFFSFVSDRIGGIGPLACRAADRQHGHLRIVWSGVRFCGFCVMTRALQGRRWGGIFFSDSEIVTLEPLGGLCIRKALASRKCQCHWASQSCFVSVESLSLSHFTFAIKCSTCPTSLEPDSFFFSFNSPFFYSSRK